MGNSLTDDERRAARGLYQDCANALKKLPENSATFDQSAVAWSGLGATVAWMLEWFQPEDRIKALDVFMGVARDILEKNIRDGR